MLICNELWNDTWFTSLEQRHKLLYIYLLCNSTKCGVFEINLRKINFDLFNGIENADPYTKDELLNFAGQRVVFLPGSETKLIISNYIYFNWAHGGVIKSKDKAAIAMLRELRSYGLTIKDINKISKFKVSIEGEEDEHTTCDTNTTDDRQTGLKNEKKISKEDIELLFEDFWKQYRATGCPRMQDKPKCKLKFAKYLSEAKDPVQLSNIIFNGLSKWKSSLAWKKDDGAFIMMPYRWLNNRNWETPPEEGALNGKRGKNSTANNGYIETEKEYNF